MFTVEFARQTKNDTKYLQCGLHALCTKRKKKKKITDISSIQCWVPSHITIHVYMIKKSVQCWVCMTNTDTKSLQFRLQCVRTKINKSLTMQCMFVYHLPYNAYLFGELLYNCNIFHEFKGKKWSRSHWMGMYCIEYTKSFISVSHS